MQKTKHNLSSTAFGNHTSAPQKVPLGLDFLLFLLRNSRCKGAETKFLFLQIAKPSRRTLAYAHGWQSNQCPCQNNSSDERPKPRVQRQSKPILYPTSNAKNFRIANCKHFRRFASLSDRLDFRGKSVQRQLRHRCIRRHCTIPWPHGTQLTRAVRKFFLQRFRSDLNIFSNTSHFCCKYIASFFVYRSLKSLCFGLKKYLCCLISNSVEDNVLFGCGMSLRNLISDLCRRNDSSNWEGATTIEEELETQLFFSGSKATEHSTNQPSVHAGSTFMISMSLSDCCTTAKESV